MATISYLAQQLFVKDIKHLTMDIMMNKIIGLTQAISNMIKSSIKDIGTIMDKTIKKKNTLAADLQQDVVESDFNNCIPLLKWKRQAG